MNEPIDILVVISLVFLVSGILLSIGYQCGRLHESSAMLEHIETQRMKINNLINEGKTN